MNFPEIIKKIKPEVFSRIFELRKVDLDLKNFEEFPEFKKQELIFVKDKVLQTEAIFNFSRKKRPLPETNPSSLEGHDPFCNVGSLTPIDELGRLENSSSITASNLTKMADYHSLIIFKKHKLEDLDQNDFEKAVDLAEEWFEKIKKFDLGILTEILIWNYHYRAGASILHPHFQVLAYKDIPQRIKFWEEKIKDYRNEFSSDYFEDYFKITREIGLAKEFGDLKVWLSLTPFKEKTIFILGNLRSFWPILNKLYQQEVQSFNIFYLYDSPSLKKFGFFVDRGELDKVNSDFGTLEIFGLPVVSYDPSELAQLLFS